MYYSERIENKFLSVILPLSPILNVYATPIPSIGVGDLIMLFFAPMLAFKLITRKFIDIRTCKIIRPLIFLMAYLIIISFTKVIIHDYSLMDVAKRLIVESFYAFLIISLLVLKSVDIKLALLVYKIGAVTVSLLLFVQVIFHYLFSSEIFFLIPFLRYTQESYGNYTIYSEWYRHLFTYSFKPTSVFVEPSHVALYVAPYIAILLCKPHKKISDYIICGMISVASMFTGSGNGILLVIVAWGTFILKDVFKTGRNKGSSLIIISLFVMLGIIISLKYGFLQEAISRMKAAFAGSGSSVGIRLLKGFKFYALLEPLEKIVGIGSGTYDSYIRQNPMDSYFTLEYMSSFSYFLVSGGLIGIVCVITYLANCYKLLKKSNMTLVLWVLTVMYFTSGALLSSSDYPVIILALSVMPASNEKYKKSYEIKHNKILSKTDLLEYEGG